MAKKYDYKIFPETWKARVLVGVAMVLGLVVIAGYVFATVSFGPPVGFGFWGWWDKIEVEYVNETDERVYIYIDERLALTVEPGETVSDSSYKIEWWFDRDVVARNPEGEVIFARRLNRDELKDLHYRLVIDD